jgi:hypothetical protein
MIFTLNNSSRLDRAPIVPVTTLLNRRPAKPEPKQAPTTAPISTPQRDPKWMLLNMGD